MSRRSRNKLPQQPGNPLISAVDLAVALGLVLTIFGVYAQVGGFEFVSYDDPLYVSENARVQAGLTLENLRWAMTAVVASNWMPVTLLSHMFDCQLFQLQSGMHHLMNVVLHMFSALLLFATLQRATGARWRSAFVAFVFALHPLHVESVAWVAERKDVLSACFFFLALYAYVRYREGPSLRGYLLVVAPFCLGLMAKPMLVTFPFVLLLFDLWPLRRTPSPKLLWEKLPLLAASAVVSAVTFFVQRSTEAIKAFPLDIRIENALIAYVTYIGQMFWPAGLAVLYPYRSSPAAWQAAAAGVLVVGLSALALRVRQRHPYLATGWFWYVGTLVPVIGVVQVGLQSRADRYMYIPIVGLLLAIAWGAADGIARWPRSKIAATAAAVLSCAACLLLAVKQTGYWQNSGLLFEHAIDVTRNNSVAEYNLGNYLMNTRRGPEAISHFEAALRIDPAYAQAESNLGMILGSMPGRMAEAIQHFEAAVRLNPNLLAAQYNLAVALAQVGRSSEAIAHYEAVQRMQPSPEVAKIIESLRAGRK